MAIRRFTQLTNAFSKKLDNVKAVHALHFAYYKFVPNTSSAASNATDECGSYRCFGSCSRKLPKRMFW